MTTHKLKTWPGYYEAIVAGTKTFEVRNNDRCFKVGDKLEFLEWRPTPGLFAESEPFGSAGSYTGRSVTCEIVYMMMNQKSLMGDNMPRGIKRLVWNLLLAVAATFAAMGSIWSLWLKLQWKGIAIAVGFTLLAILVHFVFPRKKKLAA